MPIGSACIWSPPASRCSAWAISAGPGFAIFLGHALAGEIPLVAVTPAVGDLVFGALFLHFLLQQERGAGPP
jgi:hypothetical protein